MPGEWLRVARGLKRQPRVIFTTAYDEYAFRAFEVSAVDYLLKPIDSARLAQAIERLHEPVVDTAPRGSEPTRRLGEDDQVLLREADNCWFVKMRDIRLFESEGNYTRVYFAEQRPLLPPLAQQPRGTTRSADIFPREQAAHHQPPLRREDRTVVQRWAAC
jgi:two-component system LytT family response regulator